MPRPSLLPFVAAALFAAVYAGCVSAPNRPGAQSPSDTSSSDRPSEEEVKRRATAHARYANGVIFELQHRRSMALNEYRQAAVLLPDDQELVWKVSQKFLAAREPETAIELLELAAKQRSVTALTCARLAAVELQAGHSEAALAAGQRAIRIDPAVLEGHQSVFLTRLQAGEVDEAQAILEAAEEHAVGDAAFLIRLSELYSLLLVHNPSDREALRATMLRLLDSAARLPLLSSTVQMSLADGFANLGEDERAAELYQELLETMTDAPGARDIIRSKLAEVYLRGKNPAQAREQLERMLVRDPLNVRVCYLLGSLAYDAQDLDAARDYFQRAITLRPQFEQAYYDLAGVLLNLNQPVEARGVLDRARHRFPENFAMEMLTALMYMQNDEHATALKYFTSAEIKAQATDPERLTEFFYFQYGAANERAGEYAAAERHLRKALEVSPDFAPAQNYLGYMWADAGQHLEEALELIQQAVASEPENPAYLDSLAWVLFKLDEPEAALNEILKAIQHLEEPDPVVYDHLGDIQFKLGQHEEAADAWRRSYDLDPSEPVLDKLREAGVDIDWEADTN